jgi:ABC-type sugar transport system permease subunit
MSSPSTEPSPARRAAGRTSPASRSSAPYLFLAPYLLAAAVFTLYPLFHAIVLAFHQTNGPASRAFVGIDNFRFLAHDPVFHRALRNTVVYTLCSVFLQLPLSLGLALLLDSEKSRAKALFRLVLFSPNLVGQIFVGIAFGVMFTPRYGLVNRFFDALLGFGLSAAWLKDPSLVMPAVVLTSLWVWVGFNMIYFLAALQSVDKNVVEAARVDGANPFQVFWHVTLPSMRHVLVFVLVTCIIGSFQLFELPLALLSETYGRGPDDAGLTLVGYLYDVGFNSGDLGLASAAGWVVFGIIFAASWVQIRLAGGAES